MYPKRLRCGEYLSEREKETFTTRDTERMPVTSADEMAVWVDVHVSAGC